MGDILDGGGMYSLDHILAPFEEDTCKIDACVYVPHIDEVRAVEHDGEVYLNAKDLTIAMRMMAFKSFPTLSVFNFVKQLLIELITAERA